MNVTMDIVPADDPEFAAMWQEGWIELIASGETDYTVPPPFGGKFDIALLIRADGEAAAIRAYHDWGKQPTRHGTCAGMGGTSYRVPVRPLVPGSRNEGRDFVDMQSRPVRSILTNLEHGSRLRPAPAPWISAAMPGRATTACARCMPAWISAPAGTRCGSRRRITGTPGGAGRVRWRCPRTGISRSGNAPPTSRAACSRTPPPTGTRRAMAAIPSAASRCW